MAFIMDQHQLVRPVRIVVRECKVMNFKENSALKPKKKKAKLFCNASIS